MKHKFLPTVLLMIALSPLTTFASPFDQLSGTWKVINDRTGFYVSDIVIRKNSKTQQYSAVQVKTHSNPGLLISDVCQACKGTLKDKPLFGMEVLSNMVANSDKTKFSEGVWLNTQDGLLYDINVHVNTNNQLKITGKAKHSTQKTTAMTWTRLQDTE